MGNINRRPGQLEQVLTVPSLRGVWQFVSVDGDSVSDFVVKPLYHP